MMKNSQGGSERGAEERVAAAVGSAPRGRRRAGAARPPARGPAPLRRRAGLPGPLGGLYALMLRRLNTFFSLLNKLHYRV